MQREKTNLVVPSVAVKPAGDGMIARVQNLLDCVHNSKAAKTASGASVAIANQRYGQHRVSQGHRPDGSSLDVRFQEPELLIGGA